MTGKEFQYNICSINNTGQIFYDIFLNLPSLQNQLFNKEYKGFKLINIL